MRALAAVVIALAMAQLAVPPSTKEVRGYALVLAKPQGALGIELRVADAACSGPCRHDTVGRSEIHSRAITMAEFATLLSSRVGRPVEDRTGLAGAFNLNLEWTPDLVAPPSPEAGSSDFLASTNPGPSSIFGALQAQLGLKLESIKILK